MIILGSYPIQKLLGREAKDLDLLATLSEFQEYIHPINKPTITDKNHAHFKGHYRIYDCELIWPDSCSELTNLFCILRRSLWEFRSLLRARMQERSSLTSV